jgi:hypothetical protein
MGIAGSLDHATLLDINDLKRFIRSNDVVDIVAVASKEEEPLEDLIEEGNGFRFNFTDFYN